MSNANRIHLLSLAAGTLAHLVNEQHYEPARAALNAVLKDIENLTESGVQVAKAVPADEPKTSESGETSGACGCNDPRCALIEVITGKRTDYTVPTLLASFKEDGMSEFEISCVVLDAVTYVEQEIKSGELKATPEMNIAMRDLATEGVKRVANKFGKNVQVRVVDSQESLEEMLQQIMGGGKETRH